MRCSSPRALRWVLLLAAFVAGACADVRGRADSGAGLVDDAGAAGPGAAPRDDGAGGLMVVRLPDAGAALDSGGVRMDAGSGPVPDAWLADAGAWPDDAGPLPDVDTLPYVRGVVSYTPGTAAGFGQDALPGVVLGPPVGYGTGRGSLDVVSLGAGGEIVLDFGPFDIIDGPGADFVVFENAFWPGGDAQAVFSELAEVAVSADGETWHTFPCASAGGADAGTFPGCAGWRPTLDYDPQRVVPLDPALSGGDPFDLADLMDGPARARFVRITDLSDSGEGQTAGFDLDAIGLVHSETR